MKALARRSTRPAKRAPKRQPRQLRTALPPPPPPPEPPPRPGLHYEAAWTDSWSHRRCQHQHPTLMEAAKCAMPTGAGWYVFAVQNGEPRQLSDAEEKAITRYRFR